MRQEKASSLLPVRRKTVIAHRFGPGKLRGRKMRVSRHPRIRHFPILHPGGMQAATVPPASIVTVYSKTAAIGSFDISYLIGR